MQHPPALRYDRVIALLRADFTRCHARYVASPTDEIRAVLEETRVVLLLLDGLAAVQGLPELTARHNAERGLKVGSKRGDDDEEPRKPRKLRLVHDATKW